MVRNTTGGTGTKSLARKHQSRSDGKLITPSNELELIGCVTKMYGNGMCEIYTNDNTKLIGHIRNKFRGRQKRHNMITPSTIVMIGLRDWENPYKNCDIMEIYSDSQVEQLKQIPNIKTDNVLRLRLTNGGMFSESTATSDAIDFVDEEEEIDYTIKNKKADTFELDTGDTVDIDDI
jgi:initiation factor 1A